MPALGRRCRLVTVAVAALLVASSASACTTSGGSSGTKGYITGSGVVTIVAPDKRDDPIELSGVSLTGDPIDVAAYRDTVVVLNVWASWCPPCRSEADELVEAHDELPNVTFIGINTDEDDKSAADAFVRVHDIPYESLYDEDDNMLLAFGGAVRADRLPSTVVLDRQGRIAALVLGSLTASTLIGLVEDVESEA